MRSDGREAGTGEKSLIRQIKTDWICSKMADSVTRGWFLSPPLLDLGVPFNLYQPQIISRVAAQIFPLFLHYAGVTCVIEQQWAVCGKTEDRTTGD